MAADRRIALPAAIDVAGVAARDRAAATVALHGETMGTTWRVVFACPPRREVAAVRPAIVARLDGLVGEMSHWRPDSLLSRFNRAPADSWTTLPPDFARVIGACLRIAEASGGAFDPAIGRLVDLWGFGPPGPAAPPAAAAIQSARASSGCVASSSTPARVGCANPAASRSTCRGSPRVMPRTRSPTCSRPRASATVWSRSAASWPGAASGPMASHGGST